MIDRMSWLGGVLRFIGLEWRCWRDRRIGIMAARVVNGGMLWVVAVACGALSVGVAAWAASLVRQAERDAGKVAPFARRALQTAIAKPPRGETGDSGDAGTDGMNGANGTDGGPGPDGPEGAPGDVLLSGIGANAILYSTGTMIAGDPTTFNWNESEAALLLAQPETVGHPYPVLEITPVTGNASSIALGGLPGNGASIARTDNAGNVSWLQGYGGDYSATKSAQGYWNASAMNPDNGPPGGLQFATGAADSVCQFQDAASGTPVTILAFYTNGGSGIVHIPSLAASSMVVTDGSRNLATTALSATSVPYTPSAPDNWSAPPPTTVEEGITRIAVVLAADNP
jgi:hypothetical protein